jgi:hypothetical protein
LREIIVYGRPLQFAELVTADLKLWAEAAAIAGVKLK